jgi:hypothetical protein
MKRLIPALQTMTLIPAREPRNPAMSMLKCRSDVQSKGHAPFDRKVSPSPEELFQGFSLKQIKIIRTVHHKYIF